MSACGVRTISEWSCKMGRAASLEVWLVRPLLMTGNKPEAQVEAAWVVSPVVDDSDVHRRWIGGT